MNKVWTVLAALFFVSTAALAETPAEKVKAVSDALITQLQAEKAAIKSNPATTQSIVKTLVVPHFDSRRMARLVLGKHRKAASDQQIDRFTEEFTAYLVRYYANAFANYNGETIKINEKVDMSSDKDATVKTFIMRNTGTNVPVNYKLEKQGDGSWKLVDVAIEGIGLVQSKKEEYSDAIASGGLDKLIGDLASINKSAPATN